MTNTKTLFQISAFMSKCKKMDRPLQGLRSLNKRSGWDGVTMRGFTLKMEVKRWKGVNCGHGFTL